jgi:cytochrome oxidase Cu insertion factor (SCO1/SenC/PrrC family)
VLARSARAAAGGQAASPATRLRLRAAATVIVAATAAIAGCASSSASNGPAGGTSAAAAAAQQRAAGANPDLDPGTALNGIPAPEFSLTNQFGQRMSLSDFRGKVVILAFTDSECTTVCPLTTQSMLAAKQLLGKAGEQVQLLGIDANPTATAVSDVKAYSQVHGMMNQWDFLTGSAQQLAAVWKAYDIYVQIVKGQVDHTPALFIIDGRGREQKLYMTEMSYASIGQAAQVMAQESASLLPGHPALASLRSLAYLPGLGPKATVTLATLPSGSVTLTPGKPRLTMFFATWLDQTSDLKDELSGLNDYVQAARRDQLPGLVAVDELAAEPSLTTVRGYLSGLGRPLDYQVALDPTGRVADGYGVQDQPWFVLTSAAGKIVWSHDGWLPVSSLVAAARKAG